MIHMLRQQKDLMIHMQVESIICDQGRTEVRELAVVESFGGHVMA